MDDKDLRAARIAGRTFSALGGEAPVVWSRPVYGYLALGIAALALAAVGFNYIG